jgi:hypothetical protein
MDDKKEIIEKLNETFNEAANCMKCRKDRSILRYVYGRVMEAFEKLQKEEPKQEKPKEGGDNE